MSEEIKEVRKRKRKRKRKEEEEEGGSVYAEKAPDFGALASLYPSFHPFVKLCPHPSIDWSDFNATRELTRVLLHHRHSLNWWIPDGHLCPTVTNRSNYIHWLHHLLSSNFISNHPNLSLRGFDIGTGASCIYPLLAASLHGWSFVGSDVTDVAIEWAQRNVDSNPHISQLIEIRKVQANADASCVGLQHSLNALFTTDNNTYHGPPILVGVVQDDENFDFCMCNPPFFQSLEEAGLNPKTSCGGTSHEMVCPGGERAFITRIIQDSTQLKDRFRWFTSMVGKKSNLKHLISKLWEVGVTIVKTTEFVQGRTHRWGLAWSFLTPMHKSSISLPDKKNTSFMLQGLQRQHGAINVLEAVKSHFSLHGLSCTLNTSSFTVDVTASKDDCDSIPSNELPIIYKAVVCQPTTETSNGSSLNLPHERLCFRISVFQQIPGTLLVKGSLQDTNSPLSGTFSVIFRKLEEVLRDKFCTKSV
ncbi:hypothetical protein VNO78_11015 [Psophocarpus tetragonolobus]|uniref:U6 small nuclear RNA (adenine-(43)-N(6))-methyltransferase n=1 Tax=Psophocarpus tetragonolobus TaxID=3891 RepID=A0AAN9SL15_PSOTE